VKVRDGDETAEAHPDMFDREDAHEPASSCGFG
jgi:hypothetical protein